MGEHVFIGMAEGSHRNLMASISSMKHMAGSFAENKVGCGRVGSIKNYRI